MYEIRWFFKKEASENIRELIKSLPRPAELSEGEGLRKEVYLRCMEDLGLKISRGGLEYKFRTKPGELMVLDQGGAGYLEYWEKKSWKYLKDQEVQPDPVFPCFKTPGLKGKRFVTEKVRIQRKFKASGLDFEPVDWDEKIKLGFVVELADLKVNDNLELCSMLFELVSKRSSEEYKKLLKKGMEWSLSQNWPSQISLKAEESMSYPGLFEQLEPAP
ncbi:hypothetical protein D1AOALGA4SA_8408 [Olavius algarvensis Delta 1 endosymbiont]|nr:hypothetical protein D1AOALGA4SA_8408 [Olavius algarvensis Delta 1 endosymbiont]